ncbi:hypothetical protein MAPG_05182 [Magnaporthiopsis poae ATCC 64411]|uniref:Uncharacterized protein n=1 Tax=Magnaporthiopsis poae (strain ATCC 64411 / 73-15) TaxID=644358 RepID=A0A0C4DYQ6_MAGP6|nr:hypothetical protein MAPG_05182 [Magnaporthiopsis poae ATCC 64411]
MYSLRHLGETMDGWRMGPTHCVKACDLADLNACFGHKEVWGRDTGLQQPAQDAKSNTTSTGIWGKACKCRQVRSKGGFKPGCVADGELVLRTAEGHVSIDPGFPLRRSKCMPLLPHGSSVWRWSMEWAEAAYGMPDEEAGFDVKSLFPAGARTVSSTSYAKHAVRDITEPQSRLDESVWGMRVGGKGMAAAGFRMPYCTDIGTPGSGGNLNHRAAFRAFMRRLLCM